MNTSEALKCGEDCEREDWIVGVPGVCNNFTGVCDCPVGFSGRDIWHVYNSCHIPDRGIALFNDVFLGLTALTIAFNLFALSLIVLKVNPFPTFQRRHGTFSSLTQSVASGSHQEGSLSQESQSKKPASQVTLKRTNFLQTRRKWMIRALLLFVFFPLFILPYSVLNSLEPPIFRYDANFVIDVSLGLGIACFYMGFWLVMYIYYNSLPDVCLLGKLLKLNSVFVRHRHLLERIAVGHAIVIGFSTLVLVGILPPIFTSTERGRLFVSRLYPAFNIVVTVEFMVIFFSVGLTLREIYKTARAILVNDSGQGVIDVSKLDASITNLNLFMGGMAFLTPFSVFPCGALVMPNGGYYFFFFIFISTCAGYMASMLVSVLFIKEILNTRSTLGGVSGTERKTSVIHNL